MPRRSLGDTLVELLEALVPAHAAAAGVRVAQVSLDLPLEVKLDMTGDDTEFLANVPRWRWPTDFDEPPSRLAASFHASPIEGWR